MSGASPRQTSSSADLSRSSSLSPQPGLQPGHAPWGCATFAERQVEDSPRAPWPRPLCSGRPPPGRPQDPHPAPSVVTGGAWPGGVWFLGLCLSPWKWENEGEGDGGAVLRVGWNPGVNGERARRPALRGALPVGAPFRGQAVEVLSSCPRSDSRGGFVAEGTSSHSADPLSRPLRASPSGQPPRPQPPPRRPALARSLWLPGPPSPGLNYCNVRSWLGPLPKVEQVHLPAGREQNRSTGPCCGAAGCPSRRAGRADRGQRGTIRGPW